MYCGWVLSTFGLEQIRSPHMCSSSKKGSEEAILLDMGEYLLLPKGSPRPSILTPEMLGLQQPSGGIFARAASAIGSTSRTASKAQSESRHKWTTAPPQTHSGGCSPRGNKLVSSRQDSASRRDSRRAAVGGTVIVHIEEEGSTLPRMIPLARPILPLQRMRLFQILSPVTVSRGRYFGIHLTLKPDWIQVDRPYFDAPGIQSSSKSMFMSMS